MEQIEATLANVADSATSVTLQAANPLRRGWSVYNDSSAVLYLKTGATASLTSFTVAIAAYGYYELPRCTGGGTGANMYTGVIDGIWASDAGGSARVTEYT